MTMQRPSISLRIFKNDVDCGPPPTQKSVRSMSDGPATPSAAAAQSRVTPAELQSLARELVSDSLPSLSTMAATATTALRIHTNNNNNSNNDPNHLPTSVSRNGSSGNNSFLSSMSAFTSIQSMSPQKGVWGRSSNLSSVPLLSPSELADDSEIKGGKNDPIQALLLAQMRQNLQQQEQGQQLLLLLLLQMELDSYTQPKKRARLLMDSSDSSSKGLECENPYILGGMSSSSPPETELGQNSLLGGLHPSLLKNSLSGNNGVGDNGSGNNNMTQVQQLLRKQQLEELQKLRQLKQREDMLRLSQLQSTISAVETMLQRQQQQYQQQQHAMSFENTNRNTWLVVQLKALKDQQDQHQNNSIHSKASSIDEGAVANYKRKNNNNGFGSNIANMGSQQSNVLQKMQALAKFEPQNNDDMSHPPPMVSAVSSLDSVAIMSMLLPQNQQHPQKPQQSSSNAAASRLLGTDFSLGGANGGLGNNSTHNSSLLAPIPFPPSSLGSLGMGSNMASLFGSRGEISGNNELSSMTGRAGTNLICPSTSGPVDNGLDLPPKASEVIYEQLRQAVIVERESSVGKPSDAFVDRDPDGRAHDLPTLLAVPVDHKQLYSHQLLLRYQIEVFRAGEEGTCTYTRGRNKSIQLGQIGIRCRHCKVLPVSRRKRGSVYFPRTIEGFYQAAQNVNSTHLQTGDCPLMGNALRQEFANLIATRGMSAGAGRAYWAYQASKLGLRNTDEGVVFEGYKKDTVCIQVPANGSSSPSDSSKKQ